MNEERSKSDESSVLPGILMTSSGLVHEKGTSPKLGGFKLYCRNNSGICSEVVSDYFQRFSDFNPKIASCTEGGLLRLTKSHSSVWPGSENELKASVAWSQGLRIIQGAASQVNGRGGVVAVSCASVRWKDKQDRARSSAQEFEFSGWQKPCFW